MKGSSMSPKSPTKSCRGQALVEFAVVAIVLTALILVIFEFGRIMLCYNTIANAARVGTRYAIVHGSDNPPSTSVTARVQAFLTAGSVNPSTATISVSYPDPAGSSGSGCTNPGCHVVVTVSYPYDPIMSYFPIGMIHLASTSEGVITW